MPEIIGFNLTDRKNRTWNTEGFVWIFEAKLDDTRSVYIAASDEPVTHRGQVYDPYPVKMSPQRRTEDGSLTGITITLGNAGNVFGAWVEQGLFTDREVYMKLVPVDATGEEVHTSSFTIREVTIDAATATFDVGPYRLLDAPFPAQRYSRGRCRWLPTYGGTGCEYDKSLPNAVPLLHGGFDPNSCDGTLNGPNGCRVHGANEFANGQPQRHPLRFGGFPGIPKGRARV